MHDISTTRRASWRRGAAVLTALLLALTFAAPAGAVTDSVVQGRYWSHHGGGMRMWDDGYTRNVANVLNVGRGHERSDARSALVRTDARHVVARNIARSYSACKDCRSVAVAFEVVLADNKPRHMVFDNRAIANNEGCVRCDNVAMAYQIAVVAPGIALTDDGVARLREISRQIKDVAESDMSGDEVVSSVESLVAQAMVVLDEELYQRDRRGQFKAETRAPAGELTTGPATSGLTTDGTGEASAGLSSTPQITLRSDIDRP